MGSAWRFTSSPPAWPPPKPPTTAFAESQRKAAELSQFFGQTAVDALTGIITGSTTAIRSRRQPWPRAGQDGASGAHSEKRPAVGRRRGGHRGRDREGIRLCPGRAGSGTGDRHKRQHPGHGERRGIYHQLPRRAEAFAAVGGDQFGQGARLRTWRHRGQPLRQHLRAVDQRQRHGRRRTRAGPTDCRRRGARRWTIAAPIRSAVHRPSKWRASDGKLPARHVATARDTEPLFGRLPAQSFGGLEQPSFSCASAW